MSNQEWFKSLDRADRKHVLSILHDMRISIINGVDYIDQDSFEFGCKKYIGSYEDLHEEVKKEYGPGAWMYVHVGVWHFYSNMVTI